MSSLEAVFRPLIGQLVWFVRRGHGTFLTMEFGEPHLEVVEPQTTFIEVSEGTRQHLAQRKVYVRGDWHFWMQYCDWIVGTHHFTANSQDLSEENWTAALKELEGQKLLSVSRGKALHSAVLKFDLGAEVSIMPADDYEVDDSQWSLYHWQGNIISFTHDGRLMTEESAE